MGKPRTANPQSDSTSPSNPSNTTATTGRALGDTAKLFIISVVTFLAALIWRDAIKRAFKKYFPVDNLLAYIVAAFVVSVIAIFTIYYLSRNLSAVDLDAGDELGEDIEE